MWTASILSASVCGRCIHTATIGPAHGLSAMRRRMTLYAEATMMKLYGFGPTRSLRAQWGLKELGLEFEFIPVNLQAGEHRRPEFLALNPAGKVPVLVDGDLVLTESAAIVLYLAEKYPEKKLMPTQLEQRAQVYRWVLFAMTELEQPLWRITKHTFLYPEDKRIAKDVDLAREDFTAMAAVLERHMDGRQYIVGDRI